jgi:hypothetical protein
MSKLELTDLSQSSSMFGTSKIQLINGVGQGFNIPCRSCLVKPAKSNTQDVFISARDYADGDEYPLPATDMPMPVTNMNQLHFYSSQLDAVVYVLWRL